MVVSLRSVFCGVLGGAFLAVQADEPPVVHDERLEMTLMAEAPEIRNPIGIAVGREDRIYVVESHTTLRPSDYEGPTSDRIRMLIDRDGDGQAERIATAIEGLDQAMSLAVSPWEGAVYVACAKEVLALLDHNDDGVFDDRRVILRLETDSQHPHYRFSGLAFDEEGWLYVSRGNVDGYAYVVRSADGSMIAGHGDGGAVLRCRPGGTQLEEVATGFWNVVGLDQDDQGRWLAADNDPEARGPNRLVHLVPGGDYGYRTVYGRGGHHPFLSWDGELPGTLPMVSGTGEAPSDVLACRRSSFPAAYQGQLLVTCWGASTIERHALEAAGVSVMGDASVLVSGGGDFRPVSMAADSEGRVYITDWVSDRYANHGQGRLWRLASREGVEDRLMPGPVSRARGEAEEILARIGEKRDAKEASALFNLMVHDDAFLNHALIEALSRPVFWPALLEAMDDTTATIRLGALLALRKAHHPDAGELVRIFLRDPDPRVRESALKWAAEQRDPRLVPALDEAITEPDVSLGVFEAYLAAKSALSPEVLEALAGGDGQSVFDLPYPALETPLPTLVRNESTSDHLRAMALMRLGEAEGEDPVGLLAEWTRTANPALQLAAIRGLGRLTAPRDKVLPVLKSVATRRAYEPQVRREAIATWARLEPTQTEWMLDLLNDHRASVRLEAARALRLVAQLEPTLAKLEAEYERVKEDPHEEAIAEQLEFVLYGPHDREKAFAGKRPQDLAEWQERLRVGGDVPGGRRLFESVGLLCSQCHTPGAFRNSLGPSLENLGQSVDRDRIVQSLIEPSANASPAYQAWRIKTRDGLMEQGVQIEWRLNGDLRFIGMDGHEKTVPRADVESVSALSHSIMPHGLQELMTVREMRDLVSYLESLGVRLD